MNMKNYLWISKIHVMVVVRYTKGLWLIKCNILNILLFSSHTDKAIRMQSESAVWVLQIFHSASLFRTVREIQYRIREIQYQLRILNKTTDTQLLEETWEITRFCLAFWSDITSSLITPTQPFQLQQYPEPNKHITW